MSTRVVKYRSHSDRPLFLALVPFETGALVHTEAIMTETEISHQEGEVIAEEGDAVDTPTDLVPHMCRPSWELGRVCHRLEEDSEVCMAA